MNHSENNYILFIDESGKSKLSDETGRYFLLSGVIIDSNLHHALSAYMLSLKEKSGISSTENIHAFDLFEKEKLHGSPTLKVKEIDKFFERFLSLAHGALLRVMVLHIDKGPYQKQIERCARHHKVKYRRVYNMLKKEALHDLLYETAMRKLVLEFGRFLEDQGAVGEVMAESRRQDDDATLRAFMDSTNTSKFPEGGTYNAWSRYSFKRIHSLTFQNKKGLSFGLEIADLFAWADYNTTWEVTYPCHSNQKKIRIEKRLQRVQALKQDAVHKNNQENLTVAKIKTVAGDRVSELAKFLKNVEFR